MNWKKIIDIVVLGLFFGFSVVLIENQGVDRITEFVGDLFGALGLVGIGIHIGLQDDN